MDPFIEIMKKYTEKVSNVEFSLKDISNQKLNFCSFYDEFDSFSQIKKILSNLANFSGISDPISQSIPNLKIITENASHLNNSPVFAGSPIINNNLNNILTSINSMSPTDHEIKSIPSSHRNRYDTENLQNSTEQNFNIQNYCNFNQILSKIDKTVVNNAESETTKTQESSKNFEDIKKNNAIPIENNIDNNDNNESTYVKLLNSSLKHKKNDESSSSTPTYLKTKLQIQIQKNKENLKKNNTKQLKVLTASQIKNSTTSKSTNKTINNSNTSNVSNSNKNSILNLFKKSLPENSNSSTATGSLQSLHMFNFKKNEDSMGEKPHDLIVCQSYNNEKISNK